MCRASSLRCRRFCSAQGHFALTQALLPAVRDSKGRVVHTSSLASLIGQARSMQWRSQKDSADKRERAQTPSRCRRGAFMRIVLLLRLLLRKAER